MDPYNEVEVGRLSVALETSYRALEPFRNLNRALIEEYAGSGYGRPMQPRHEILVNLMNQTVDAYMMALVANRPRVLLSSQIPERTYFSKQFGVAMNNLIEEIGLEFTLRQWVLDAFFCVGLVKIHMADSGVVQFLDDVRVDPGKPFVSNIALDNWVHDTSATRWEQMRYAGDSYRIPFRDLQSAMYDQDVAKDLKPSTKLSIDPMRVERISRGETVDNDELEPMIDLCDIWIPQDDRVYTFPLTQRGQFKIATRPVAILPGNSMSYRHLGFNDVPENIMPTSPASHLGQLHRLVNNLVRKQRRQAQRQKEVNTYSPAGVDDAQRLQNADDGAFVKVNDVSQIGQIKMGGVDPGNQAFLLGVMQMYDRMAGNLTAMAGLGSQAPTASQEQLIQGRVSNKEAQMQYRVLDATSRLMRDLGGLLWNDRIKVIPGRLPIDGTDYSVDATWRPDDREGSFFDYQISIDVYSMAYQSPEQRVAKINQLITQIYAPLAPIMAQQGGQINLQKLTELYADLLNVPQLRECIEFTTVPQVEGPEGESPAGPSATTRTYERRNVAAGPTPQNQSQIAQEQWLAMAAQGGNG